MSSQLFFKVTAKTVLLLALVHVSFWSQRVDGQFMMSRFHLPMTHPEERPQRLLREVMDVVLPIYEHDRQRLKLEVHKPDESVGKVKKPSKRSSCVPAASGRGALDGKPGADCSEVNADKPLPLDDVKRMILRIEAMLDKLIKKGYID